MSAKIFKGKWKIIEMDNWDIEPGWFIEFDGKRCGSLHFICVDVEIDYRMSSDTSNKRAEFTFYGNDEMDETFGRGWAEINGANLNGYIYFHRGNESGFKAKLMNSTKSKMKKQ